jgi:hypothetical protein
MKTIKSIKDVRIYDNGGETADRFSVCFPWDIVEGTAFVACVGMSEAPYHPQGFCQHCTALEGEHLGKRIDYVDLNDDCARVIREELAAYNA